MDKSELEQQHQDSEHGYYTIEITFERDPCLNVEEAVDTIMEAAYNAFHPYCLEISDEPDRCGIEHYESGGAHKCLFYEDLGDVSHL